MPENKEQDAQALAPFDRTDADRAACAYANTDPVIDIEIAYTEGAYWQWSKLAERVRVAEKSLMDEREADIQRLVLETRVAELEYRIGREDLLREMLTNAKSENARLIRLVGLTVGALKGVQVCPADFNKDGLQKVIDEVEQALEGAGGES